MNVNTFIGVRSRKTLNLGDMYMETLRKVWEAWKRIGQFIGDQVGRVVLTIFYFTLFMPFALGVRFFKDPLALRPSGRTKWLERTTKDLTLEDTRRLF
jgi:hypothetical protein